MNFNKDKRLYNLLTLVLYLLAQQPCSFQNPICTTVFFFFYCLLPHVFPRCVHVRCDTINSHLTQILMCATVNVKAMF